MRSSNPALASAFSTNTPDRSLSELLGPQPASQTGAVATELRTDRMTIEGVIHRTLLLLGLLIVGGAFGYQAVTVTDETTVNLPSWVVGALFVGIGLVFVNLFRPQWAKFVSPVYAVVQGAVVGAISKVYEVQYDGIVLQAAGLTVAVFLLMLALYASRTIRATPRLITGIVAATGAVFVMYMVTFVLGLFGVDLPFIHDSGPIGILFSLGLVGLAAFNFILDFYVIENGVAAGAPADRNWQGAFGILLTLVWLYLEMLRLLSKLRR
jgi:uncharacterized YccA/Bax inhibitor family protein